MQEIVIERNLSNVNFIKRILKYQLKFYFTQISSVKFNENNITIQATEYLNKEEVESTLDGIMNKLSNTALIGKQNTLFDSRENGSLDKFHVSIEKKHRDTFVRSVKRTLEKNFENNLCSFKKTFEKYSYPVSIGINAYNNNYIKLYTFLDELIKAYFEEIYGAEEINVPSMILTETIDKSGYFETGCQHISFVAPITNNPSKFDEFQKKYSELYKEKQVYNYVKKPKYILNPALCLHCYPLLKGYKFDNKSDVILTVKGSCFRDESGNLNNQERLHEFSMREIVFFTNDYKIKKYQKESINFFYLLGRLIGLDFKLEIANDIFFSDNAEKQLFSQLISDDKIELCIYCNNVSEYISVASINKHHNHFSKPFELKDENEKLINTMCIGFGLDRLVLALLNINQNQSIDQFRQKLLENLKCI